MSPERFGHNPSKLRQFFRIQESKEKDLFSDVARHSRDYMDILGFTAQDIERLEKMQGWLGMYPTREDYIQGAQLVYKIDGEEIALVATHTCCHPYGEFDASSGWRDLIMAVARNHALNQSTGYGTTWITAIGEEWHDKLLAAIKEDMQNDSPADELFGFINK